MRGRRRFGGGRRASRPVQWITSGSGYAPLTGTALASGTLSAIELCGSSAPAADFDPPQIDRFTVMRIRGDIGFRCIPAAAQANSFDVVCGILLVSSSVANPTPSFDPSLNTDGQSPWLWLGSRHALISNVNDPAGGPSPVVDYRFELDIKAKRIIRQAERLVLFTQSSFSGGATLDMFPMIRVLIARVA